MSCNINKSTSSSGNEVENAEMSVADSVLNQSLTDDSEQISSMDVVNPSSILRPDTNMLAEHFSNCVLYPPEPDAPLFDHRKKPLGCKTIFVGGLPQNVTKEMMKEIFEKFGDIMGIYMNEDSCRIRFASEESVEKALILSEYKIKIADKNDDLNTGRFHIFYAKLNEDQREYECQELRKKKQICERGCLDEEWFRSCVPPPAAYSDAEAAVLDEKLKWGVSFLQTIFKLQTWLETGEVNEKNSEKFYSMISSMNDYFHILMRRKHEFVREYCETAGVINQRMQHNFPQINEIKKVFFAISDEKTWNYFTDEQKNDLELLQKQINELSNDSDPFNDAVSSNLNVETDMVGNKVDLKTIKELQKVNDTLRCQLKEVEKQRKELKQERERMKEKRDREMSVLMQDLLKVQESLRLVQGGKHKIDINELQSLVLGKHDIALEIGKEFSPKAPKLKKYDAEMEVEAGEHSRNANGSCSAPKSSNDEIMNNPDVSCSDTSVASTVKTFTEAEVYIVSLITTFLSVMPQGADVDQISSYLRQFLLHLGSAFSDSEPKP